MRFRGFFYLKYIHLDRGPIYASQKAAECLIVTN